MAGWLMAERRGISWRDQTLASISAPPMHLVAFLGVLLLWLYLTGYSNYKVEMEKSMLGLKLLLFVLPVVLILIADVTMRHRWWWPVVGVSRTTPYKAVRLQDEGSSPWWVALVVVLLLVMVKFHSSVQSSWF